jgi:hypothetical protein
MPLNAVPEGGNAVEGCTVWIGLLVASSIWICSSYGSLKISLQTRMHVRLGKSCEVHRNVDA